MRLLVMLAVALALIACSESGPEPLVVVPTEISTQWGSLPHRLSRMETTSRTDRDGETIAITGQNDGGEFGFLDTAWLRQSFDLWRAPGLDMVEGSILVEIGPGQADGASASTVVTGLDDAGTAIAFLRGYRVDTDLYETPPAFAMEIPYAPALGYTTQGFGLALEPPLRGADGWTVTARARNQLGLSDRGDMNEAIPQATTWVRVDFVLVGVREGEAARAETEYSLGFAEYNTREGHAHARESEQQIIIPAAAGHDHALFGMTAFDIWLNVPGRSPESCAVVQDAINAWDEPISGPGRYLTELTARLWNTDYDSEFGQARARIDLMLSNRSTIKEVGNLCLAMRGEAGVLLFDGDAQLRRTGLVETDLLLPTEFGGDAPITEASLDLAPWLD